MNAGPAGRWRTGHEAADRPAAAKKIPLPWPTRRRDLVIGSWLLDREAVKSAANQGQICEATRPIRKTSVNPEADLKGVSKMVLDNCAAADQEAQRKAETAVAKREADRKAVADRKTQTVSVVVAGAGRLAARDDPAKHVQGSSFVSTGSMSGVKVAAGPMTVTTLTCALAGAGFNQMMGGNTQESPCRFYVAVECHGNYTSGFDVRDSMTTNLLVTEGQDLCVRAVNDVSVTWVGYKP